MTARTSRAAARLTYLAATAIGIAACSDPAPPETAVASIALSVPDTGTSIRFRDPLVVKATPQGALGVPLVRAVTWTSVTPALLAVQPLGANGDSARIRAAGVGMGEVRVSAGGLTRSFQVTVQDTVFSVTLTPGSLSLIAGDTVSFTATVAGPPNASRAIRWDVSNATVLPALPTLDSLVYRAQVRAAGTTSVRATALADTTKVASTTVVAQQGKLAFLVQPSTTARETPFSPAVSVVVEDASGNVSSRAANAVTLGVAPGTCSGSLTGVLTENAVNGIAVFRDLAISARCAAAILTATALPLASSAASQPFSVGARSCGTVAPIGLRDTVSATVESVDCVVVRDGKPMYSHTYDLAVPLTTTFVRVRLDATTSAFAPRIESYLWAQEPGASWADSLPTTGTLTTQYVLGPGTYRLSITSPAPLGTGAYVVTTSDVLLIAGPAGDVCFVRTTTNISFNVPSHACSFPFASRPGQGEGTAYLVYLPPGKAVTASYRRLEGTSDAYLEVFDVTNTSNPPVLVAFDDNSGGGTTGTDAQLRINAAPTGRFLEIRALVLNFNNAAFYNLTIQP